MTSRFTARICLSICIRTWEITSCLHARSALKRQSRFWKPKVNSSAEKQLLRLQRDELVAKLEQSLGSPVHCVGAGPTETRVIGIVTGAAGSEIYAVAEAGVDTFITGESPHWAAVAAEELGVNLLLGGHYATETLGVKALAAHLSERFKIPWEFIDHPTGL